MDNKQNRGEPDRSRISLSESYEMAYWTRTLGISEAQLRAVVARVGNSADKVRAELRQ